MISQKEGGAIFARFSASSFDTLANYERVIEALLKRWLKSPLAGDLKKLAAAIRTLKKSELSGQLKKIIT